MAPAGDGRVKLARRNLQVQGIAQMKYEIKLDAAGFAINAGAWQRAWKFTPQGARTAAAKGLAALPIH